MLRTYISVAHIIDYAYFVKRLEGLFYFTSTTIVLYCLTQGLLNRHLQVYFKVQSTGNWSSLITSLAFIQNCFISASHLVIKCSTYTCGLHVLAVLSWIQEACHVSAQMVKCRDSECWVLGQALCLEETTHYICKWTLLRN